MGSILRSIMPRLVPSICFGFVNIVFFCIFVYWFCCDVDVFDLPWQVSMDDMIYLGFVDGASQNTQNLASVAWVIYYPSGQLLVTMGICISPSLNNVVEYTAIVNLLSEAISLGLGSLVVYLDSQLVVSHLNNIYRVDRKSVV